MLVVLSFVLACASLTHGTAPVISNAVGQVTLKRDQNSDQRLYELQVQDADSVTFTCQVDSVAPPTDIFQARTLTGDNGYWVYFIYQGQGTVTEDSYSLNLACTDGAEASNVAQVRVDIINNAPPRLTTDYSSAISVDISNTFEPQDLHAISVQDPDGDLLTCTSSPPAGFSVTDNCIIRNTIDLRQLTASSETITVSVSDGVNSPVTFRVPFTFTNLNQPPSFKPHGIEISRPENVPGDVFMAFSAADTDVIEMTWHVDPPADRLLFDLQSTDGTVQLAAGKAFDFEGGVTSYVVTCLATDGFLTSSSSVTIFVLDVNEAPELPVTQFAVTIPEGQAGSASIPMAIAVNDPDMGDTYTFSIMKGQTYSDLLYLSDTVSPRLSNAQALDLEGTITPPTFPITLVVTDKGGLTATADVFVTVSDVNDKDPKFSQVSYTFKVYSGMAAGTLLRQFSGTDDDISSPNNDFDFSLMTSTPAGKFGVETDGRVRLSSSVTETYGTTFSLQVKVTDKGSPSRSSTAAVIILWNEAPEITSLPATVTMAEDPTVITLLHTLVTSDPENDPVACDVVAVSPSVSAFQVWRINTTNLGVYYTGETDLSIRGTGSIYVITVRADDEKGGATSKTLTVTLTPNSPPTLSCVNSASVVLNVSTTYAVSTDVYSLTVTDTENDDITISMTSSPNTGSFRFDDASRKIKVGRDLRSESATSHSLTLSVTDGKNPLTCIVYVTLTGENQAPRVIFPHDRVTVAENVTPGSTLLTVSVTDDSSNPSVSCDVTPTAYANYFDITVSLPAVNIKLASSKAFDFESGPTSFVISCSADDNYRQTTAAVAVVVLDVNEAPYFRAVPVQVTVSEGPANTVSVLPLYSAADPDGDVLTYQIVPGGTYSNLFSIRMSDGTLTNQQPLERDNNAPNPVTIKVAVSDPDKLTATTDVLVHLTDINDNAPTFNQTSYSFKVGLSSAKGDWVGAVGVTDVDAGNNNRTDLVMTSSNPTGYFKLEPDGSLFLIKDLDVGYGTVFTLTIKATDNGSPMLTSTSVITITWYSGPNIVSLPAVTYCHEDLQAKTKLHDLNVLDTVTTQFVCVKDESLSTSTKAFDVIYSTESRNYAVMYTGAVSLAASPDVSTYDIAVRCYDRNGQVTKVLRVDVIRNSAPLCIGSSSVRVDASATKAGDVVYTIQATDVDNDTLTFSVVSTLFYVGTYSGVLRATDTLRYVTADDHLVSVAVKDAKHTSYCSLVIQFTNINKVPVFSNLGHTLEVPEDTAAGSNLYTITVTDLTVFTTNIEMTWTSADKNKFALGQSGLQATLRLAPGQKLDYESGKQTYTLTFTASDGYLTSEPATLTIVVTPVNEPPYFAGGLSYYTDFEEISSKIAVLGCNTRDPDAGDTVTLSLSGSNANLFSVQDLDNCQVTLKAEYDLDTGASSTVNLTLLATDSGGLTAHATLVVHIVEINDNTPQFAGPVTLVMDYGMRAADFIGSVTAVDIDLGTNGAIYYSVLKEPANPDVADQYISFLSNGSFIVRQSMDNVITTAEKFQYVILAADDGAPQRTSSTTVNILYDPFLTTTTTTVATTSTTEVTSTTEASADTSLLNQPLFIGLLAALIGLAVIITAGVIVALLKHFNSNKSFQAMKEDTSKESPTPRRSSTPLRPNRISVYGMESQVADGRKISRMVQLPLPSAY